MKFKIEVSKVQLSDGVVVKKGKKHKIKITLAQFIYDLYDEELLWHQPQNAMNYSGEVYQVYYYDKHWDASIMFYVDNENELLNNKRLYL